MIKTLDSFFNMPCWNPPPDTREVGWEWVVGFILCVTVGICIFRLFKNIKKKYLL